MRMPPAILVIVWRSGPSTRVFCAEKPEGQTIRAVMASWRRALPGDLRLAAVARTREEAWRLLNREASQAVDWYGGEDDTAPKPVQRVIRVVGL